MLFSWYGSQATVNVVAIVMHILVTLRDACCWADEPEPAPPAPCPPTWTRNPTAVFYYHNVDHLTAERAVGCWHLLDNYSIKIPICMVLQFSAVHCVKMECMRSSAWLNKNRHLHMQLPISTQQQRWSYLEPFRRYGGIKVENWHSQYSLLNTGPFLKFVHCYNLQKIFNACSSH